MEHSDPASTRERILTEAMRLFGERGYQATRVAEIEEAAGLSPGSGSLYKHFPSKAALLAEGVAGQLETGRELFAALDDPSVLSQLPVPERMAAVVRAGLRRLDRERDLNRLLVRDLNRFPELLQRVGDEEMRRVQQATAGWLSAQAGDDRDWSAVAVVLTSAVANYWLLRDVFGQHPSGVDEDAFVAALTTLAGGLLEEKGGDW